jgi:hypothetical protein
MTKKLFVPNRILAQQQKNINPTSPAISKAFKNDETSKNEDDPSKLDASVIDRLPTPTGYRMLVIPYYPKEKTKGGVFIPDATYV